MAEEFIKIEEISPKTKHVNVKFKVVSTDDVRNVRSKRDRTPHAVTEATVGDETGTVLLTLWDEYLEQIEVGKTYSLENGYVSLFKGKLRLNIGKYGGLEKIEDLEGNVNMENNISEKVHEDRRRSRPHEWFSSGSFWP